MSAPSRPVLRWFGGKWTLAPWLIGFFPAHRVYVEPFGGAASVLMRKPRAFCEVYNDLDAAVVGLFRVLRDPPSAAELRRRLELTPFARAEFDGSYEPSADPIESARRLVVRCFMGFGSTAMNPKWKTGFRASSMRSGTAPSHDWANYPAAMDAFVERLAGVVVERRPASEVIAAFDRPDALLYVDPPYLRSTRGDGGRHSYTHEIEDAGHVALAQQLHGVRGMVVVSGYHSPLYEDLFGDWERHEREHLADGARRRTEVVWLNPACAHALGRQRQQLALEVG